MQVVCEVCGYNVSVPGQRCQPDDLLMAGGRRAVVPVFEIDVVEHWMEGHYEGGTGGVCSMLEPHSSEANNTDYTVLRTDL